MTFPRPSKTHRRFQLSSCVIKSDYKICGRLVFVIIIYRLHINTFPLSKNTKTALSRPPRGLQLLIALITLIDVQHARYHMCEYLTKSSKSRTRGGSYIYYTHTRAYCRKQYETIYTHYRRRTRRLINP